MYFDYFRSITILLIIAGHSYGPWTRNNFLEISISNTITGGTALFVFISGFFFHAIFNEKISYQKFMKKKILNVLVPYILLSLLYLLIYYIYYEKFEFQFGFSDKNTLDDICNCSPPSLNRGLPEGN